MGRRMAIVFLALVNGLVALYLHLYKLGLVGTLACTSGGCDRAMFSRWGWFLGVDVALIGVIGYTLLFVTGLTSLQPRWLASRGPVSALLGLAILGFVFTLRLKYGEFVVLKTFCKWCAISTVSITIIAILAAFEWRGLQSKE
jgi:uncharacterized membrane protein